MEENENKKYNKGCLPELTGCGCSIVILWGIIASVVWAWHIHWLFGILLLLFILILGI